MEIGILDIVGHWIAIFITIATLSYLYADNPFYKLAEHVFVGVSIGYVLVVQYFDVLRPNLIDRLLDPALGAARAVYLIPLMLVVFLFLRLTRRWSWLGRIAIAFVIGIYAGLEVPAVVNTDLVQQLASTVKAVNGYATGIEGWADVGATLAEAVGLLVLVLGMAAGLVYFFFSIEHKGVVGAVAKGGVWVLMVGFGAAFGYTVQGRISLAIGRAMYCLGSTQSEAEAAQLHSKLVSVICVVLIFGTIAWIKSRRGRAEPDRGPRDGR